MIRSWTSFRNALRQEARAKPSARHSRPGRRSRGHRPTPGGLLPPEKARRHRRPNGTLDAVGQKNELIRVRFANLDRPARGDPQPEGGFHPPERAGLRPHPLLSADPVAPARNRGGAPAGDRNDQALRRELGRPRAARMPVRRTILRHGVAAAQGRRRVREQES